MTDEEEEKGLAALKIAKQVVRRLYAAGKVPDSVCPEDLYSEANEAAAVLLRAGKDPHPDVDQPLFRTRIKSRLKNFLKHEYLTARIEVPNSVFRFANMYPAAGDLPLELLEHHLTRAQLEVIVPIYGYGETLQTCAKALGITLASVQDRHDAAIARLQKIFSLGPLKKSLSVGLHYERTKDCKLQKPTKSEGLERRIGDNDESEHHAHDEGRAEVKYASTVKLWTG